MFTLSWHWKSFGMTKTLFQVSDGLSVPQAKPGLKLHRKSLQRPGVCSSQTLLFQSDRPGEQILFKLPEKSENYNFKL